MNNVTLTLTKDEANYLMAALDTHVRAKGLNQAGSAYAVAQKVNEAIAESQKPTKIDLGEQAPEAEEEAA